MIEFGGQKYIITTMQDITERKQAEKQIVQMKRLYATLSQVNQTIVRVKDRADLYQSICDVAVQFGEFAMAWIGLLNAETGQVTPTAASGADLAHWPFPLVNIHEDQFKNGLITSAIHTSQVVTTEDIATDERFSNLQSSFLKENLHSTAIIPFQLRGDTIGIVTLISHEVELFKSQDETLLFKEMGGDISFALDTLETEAERQQAENKLRENISRLDLAMQSANMAWWEMNIATGDVTFSERKAQMLGYPPEQFKHYSDFMALVHPEDSDKAMNAMQRHIDGVSDKYEVEYRISTKSEGYKWFYDLGSIVKRDSNGTPLNATGLVIDITERKRTEAALSESEKLFSKAFRSSLIAITITNQRSGKYIEVNDAWCSIYGFTAQEAIGHTSMELSVVDNETRQRIIDELKTKGTLANVELALKDKAGNTHTILFSSENVDIAGEPCVLSTGIDITARKRVEEQQSKLTERLDLATHAGKWAFGIGISKWMN